MNLTGRRYDIEAGEHRATVVEVGAGLQRYTVGGVEVTCGYGEDVLPPKGCGITLVPWPNRIRDGRYTFEGTGYQLPLTEPAAHNAIHGLGRWVRWQMVRREPAQVTLRLDVVPQTGYPFPLAVDVTYALHPDDGLTISVQARNPGRTRAPFGVGAHPYLSTRGHPLGEVTLRLPADELLVTDEQNVPVGTRAVDGTEQDLRGGKRLASLRMDAGFTGLSTTGGRGDAEMTTPSGGARLWFDEVFRYVQVYTLDELTPGRPGIALEPMTCAPDAFNSGAGLIVLEPGGGWTGSWGIAPI